MPRLVSRLFGTLSKNEITDSPEVAIDNELRANVPFEALAAWEDFDDRPDPVELIQTQHKDLSENSRARLYSTMLSSPLAFFCESACIMASDLSRTPVTNINVQACGNAHIGNFGLVAIGGGPAILDICDYDDTARAPWEWDIKRLATSAFICGQAQQFELAECRALSAASAMGYRKAMSQFSRMSSYGIRCSHLSVDELRLLSKALTYSEGEAGQLGNDHDDVSITSGLLFGLTNRILSECVENLRLSARETALEFRLVELRKPPSKDPTAIHEYWTAKIQNTIDGRELLIQVREARDSVLQPFVGTNQDISKGERLCQGQKAIQSSSDPVLSYASCIPVGPSHRDYCIRQAWSTKACLNHAGASIDSLTALSRACGWTLARAHAKTGSRVQIANYLGEDEAFDTAIGDFAEKYAAQNYSDYARFVECLGGGK